MPDTAAHPPAGPDLEVVVLEGDDHLAEVQRLLDAAEAAAGMALIDESEQERLATLATGTPRPVSWSSALLRTAGRAVAYAAVTVPVTVPVTVSVPVPVPVDGEVAGGGVAAATGDVAVLRPIRDAVEVTAAALTAAHDLAYARSAPRLVVWMRAVGPAEVDAADRAGFHTERRLRILGRSLPATGEQDAAGAAGAAALEALTAAGTEVRAYRPDLDDAEVVAVLAAAYHGTDDGGWDLERFRERRSWSWFRPEDLLVAADPDGRLAGLHWLKRRGGGTGEVYNLAVHPRAQGRGVGPALLHAGLTHLAEVGCGEVILWVDTANERAVSLYRRAGFVTRWEDLAVARDVEVAGG